MVISKSLASVLAVANMFRTSLKRFQLFILALFKNAFLVVLLFIKKRSYDKSLQEYNIQHMYRLSVWDRRVE